jgi:hypothetical protein
VIVSVAEKLAFEPQNGTQFVSAEVDKNDKSEPLMDAYTVFEESIAGTGKNGGVLIPIATEPFALALAVGAPGTTGIKRSQPPMAHEELVNSRLELAVTEKVFPLAVCTVRRGDRTVLSVVPPPSRDGRHPFGPSWSKATNRRAVDQPMARIWWLSRCEFRSCQPTPIPRLDVEISDNRRLLHVFDF